MIYYCSKCAMQFILINKCFVLWLMVNVSTYEPPQLHSNGKADTTDNSRQTMLKSGAWQGNLPFMNF